MPINIANTIRNFIIDNFLFEDDGSLTHEMSLIENGIIDSTGILELVVFLEDTFGLCVKDEELVPENLSSIHNISVFIKSKRNGDAPILS
jgi:acyl carrier protein